MLIWLKEILRPLTRWGSVATCALLWACADASAPPAADVTEALADGVVSSVPGDPTQSRVIADQYIVTFHDDGHVPPGLARKLVDDEGGVLRYEFGTALRGFAAKLPAKAIDGLRRNPHIASIEHDMEVGGTGVQLNPPSWGLDRIDQRGLPLDKSFTAANDGDGVHAYILDSGIRTSHSEFGGRASGAFTAFNDGYGTEDCHGHGTHVAGTVGGATYGVAKKVRLYSVRVLGCDNRGSYSGIIAGIDWVTKNRTLPAVANMSLGGSYSSAVNSAVQASIRSGVVYALAAMNNGADACSYSPASTADALTVGASTSSDAQASYSNFGPCVDLFAPGSSIRSSYHTNDGAVATMSGTSMATPHVAGAAALYLAANRSATPAQVAQALTSSATRDVLGNVAANTPNLLLYLTAPAPAPAPLPEPTEPSPEPSEPPPAPVATNQAPTASFTASCPRGRCSFDAKNSRDDGGIVAYHWDFGDGTSAGGSSERAVQHTYTKAGSYTITLTVTDAAGLQGTAQLVVTFKKL